MPNFPSYQDRSMILERPPRVDAFDNLSCQEPSILVFIDRSLEEVILLAAGVQPEAEVILLDPEQDGVGQITQVLTEYPAVASVHLVAHGMPGSLRLGSTELSLETIEHYASQLQTWSNSLDGSSLSIYGCEVASGQAGKLFLQRLGQLTGANIAASTGKVGSPKAGGHWQLDYQIGQIDAELVFLPQVRETYTGVFANYNESVDGDISDSRSAPDSLQLEGGVNSLTATSSGGDLEYITVNVPAGFQLDSLVLASYASEDDVAFAGLQSGTTFTEPPSGTNRGNLLGWSHFGSDQLGDNILDDIGRGSGAIGFTAPLSSGNYTFWLQQLGEPSTYTLEFNVSPVATSKPSVSISASPTTLVEEDGTNLTLTFTLSEPPPAGGLNVTLDSTLARALAELDVLSAVFNGARLVSANSDSSGFTIAITAQTATIQLPVFNDTENEGGSEQITFALQPSNDYNINPSDSSFTLTINDSDGQSSLPVVSFSASPTTLVENEGTSVVLSFSLDQAPPAGGVTVYLDSNTVDAIREFDISTLEFTGGEFPEPNQDASGFYFTITEQTATITLPVIDDGETEGTEAITFALQTGEGYTVDPDSNSTTLTINDEDVISMPVVSFDTIAGSFDFDDNILASELVRSLEDGSSLLTFVFNVDTEIPEGGLIVDVNSDIDLTDYFTGLARPPFGIGGQIIEAIYDPETGEATGFRFRIDEQNAQVALRLINDEDASGIEEATFTLEDGEDYDVNPAADSSTVTLYDTLANVPSPTSVPEVNFSVSTTSLVESAGTVLTIDFTVDGEIPEGGLLVSVAALEQFLGDFDIFAAEVEGGVFPAPNFLSTGFFFKILESEASITIPVFPDGESEGTELVTLSLQEAPGYTISPDAEPITLTLTDTATSEIQVSLSTTPTLLIEEEGTVAVQTFTLSAPPPEGGITVTVNVPNFKEFDINAITVEGGMIAEKRENGFDLTITAQTATVNLPVDDDGLAGGVQPITFTLVDGEGYQISPTANTSTVTIVDTPADIPPPTTISEPNDIISLAVDTRLSESYPNVSFTSRIDYDNTNRYAVEGGFLYIDASEDVDLYKVNLEAGDTIKIDVDANQFGPGRKVDTYLRVFDASGTELASTDDSAAPDEIFDAEFQSYIEFTAPSDGVYYVGVSIYGNGEYDPNEPGSGTGNANPAIPAINEYGPGEYTLNISLNDPDAFTAEPTVIPPGTGEGPAISLFTVSGTYGDDFDNLGFDIVAPGIAETVAEGAASALNIVLVADGEIPEGGIEVYVQSDVDLTDYFGGVEEGDYSVPYGGNLTSKPFSRGGEFLNAVYDENGQATGFIFRLEDPFAAITFGPSNREEAESDGPEDVTFSLVESAGYTVSEQDSSTVTFYDTVADIPAPTTTPEVSIEVSPTELIESEETVFTITLSLSAPPPPEGVQVYVSGNAQDFLNELAVFEAQFDGGFAVADGAVSGFYFLMTEQTATITLPVFNSVDIIEGIEQFNVELKPGAGYTVNPDASSVLLTIKDTPDSQIQVSLTSETETSIESEGTVATLNFSLSVAPPEEGVIVTVSNPDLLELDLASRQLEGAELVGVSPDNTSFTLKIIEQNATVSVAVADDGEEEASETVTFTVEAGDGYQVNPEGNEVSVTIYDSPDTAPTSTEEVNDTISTAIATGLSAANATVTFDGEISQYFVEDDEGNELTVDASEDIDFYSFTLEAGQTVKIDVDSIAYELEGYPTQRLDSELRLFNAEGVQLAFNFDGYAPDELFVANRDPYLEFTAETTGTYYVGVAQWQNRVYDPLTAENSSGRVDANAGRNTGAYEITLTLDDIEPIVSFYTIEGTFDPSDNILAPELVRSVEEGASLLTFVFNVDREIPEGGIVVDVISDINLTDYFTGLARPPFSPGGQILEAIYDEDGNGIGFKFRIDEQNALVSLRLINDEDASGIVDATFTLEDGEDYDVNPAADSSTVTIYDTLENVPEPPVGPEVNFSVSTTSLVESDGTVLTIDFTVDGEIPEGGLLVSVAALEQFLGDFDIFAAEVEGGVFPAPNFLSTGFFFKILESEASITIPIFEDEDVEGIERVTLSLQEAPGYTISPDAEPITLTLSDTATSEIQVSLSTTPTLLIEEEGTVAVQTFTLSAPPPAGGITVRVNVPNFKEFDLGALTDEDVEGGTIAQLRENGYDLLITEQTATVNLPVDDDGLPGGVQSITFTLVDGTGYQVSPTANTSTVTIVDTPGDIPPPTTISEPNDIISLAVDTRLGELYPTASFSSSISYDNTNRYAVEGGFLYVDATEDVDLYKVELQAGDVLRLDIDALQIGSTLNSVLRVFDAAGTQLAQNDNGSAPGEAFLYRNDSYLEFTATTAGTYYVGVSSNPNGEFPAIANEDPYDPNVPASGTGRSTGTYTLNMSLNQEIVQEPTTPDPSTGTGPVISLETVAGVFGSGDNILAPAAVRSLETGASLVNLILSAEGEIPEGGVEVYISSDILLSDYFNIANFPFTPGGQVVGAFYNEEGEASGLVVNLLAPTAIISLRLFNNAAATGIEEATFTLVDAAGYVVDPENSSDTVTIYDTIANVPAATVTPEVSFSATTTSLSESEGTETTLNFSLSEAPPEEGVLVYVAAPQQFLGDFDVLNAEVEGGIFPAPNFSSSGFFFRIYEQEASITISAFPDEDIEGIESYTLSLQPAPGYTIDPDAEPVTLTITDTATSLIQVSLSRSPATLVEAAGTVAIQTFTLSAPPPEGGVTVSVSAPNLSEFDVAAIANSVTGGTIAAVRADGFDLTITERTATVSLPVASDAVEGTETATFSLVAGTGYQIGTTGNSVSFTILDEAAVTETEVNDTIAQAQDTNLSATNTSFTINGAISVGPNSRPSQIDASEDIDLYKVDLVAGETIVIDVDSTTYTIAASTVPQRLDSELRVFNAAGEQLAFNADGFAPDELFTAGRDPYLEFTATESGSYYVGVAQWQNRVYDPLTAENSSGRIDVNAGRNTGAYTLNIDLTAPPTVNLTVSPELITEAEGTFATFSFNVEGEIPTEGSIVGTSEFFDSQFDFNFEFEDPAYLSGIEYYDYIESETGEVTVLWKLTAPDAFIKVKAFDDTIAEEDYTFTLNLKPGEGYVVGSDTASLTISDGVPNLDDPVVSISFEPTSLEEGDSLTLTLNVVDGVIPEGGLEVNVASDVFGSLGEFVIFDEEGNFLPIYEGFAGQPVQNGDASGFFATIAEETATITLDVFDDGPNEGKETFTYSLLDGEIYGVDPDAGSVTIAIDDGDERRFTGTSGADVFETGVSPEGFNASNDFVFAGAGNDLLDTSAGLGNNRLYGQSGDDTFYLGSNDRAVGGSGSDQFWVFNGEYPESANTIADFEIGVDVIGFADSGLSFDDLVFTPGNNTLISAEGKDITRLLGVNSNQLTADNFTFS